jgi:hypothetical protein
MIKIITSLGKLSCKAALSPKVSSHGLDNEEFSNKLTQNVGDYLIALLIISLINLLKILIIFVNPRKFI